MKHSNRGTWSDDQDQAMDEMMAPYMEPWNIGRETLWSNSVKHPTSIPPEDLRDFAASLGPDVDNGSVA